MRRLHRWAGLALGLVLAVVAASGGLLLFKDDYLRARLPRLAEPVAAADVSQQAEVLDQLFARVPLQSVRVVRFPRDGSNAFELRLADGSQALADPLTGELLERWSWRDSFPAFLFELHANLLAGEVGHFLNGAIGLAGAFFVVTGVALWWPGRHRVYHPSRAIPPAVRGPELVRSHAASGVLLALPLAISTATGTALVFDRPVTAALRALLDETRPRDPDGVVTPGSQPMRPWSEILGAAGEAFADGELVMLYPGVATNAAVRLRIRLPGEWHSNGRSWVVIDPYSGAVVQAIDARAQGQGTRLGHAIYPVHAARGWARTLLPLPLVAAIGTVWLALAGGAAWLLRRAPPGAATRAATPAPRMEG